MGEYNEECLKTFLEKQEQLFDEPVAETLEAAEAFLEDCMAVVVESLAEVREYFVSEACISGFYLVRQCAVKTVERKQPKRYLLAFSRHRNGELENATEIMMNQDGNRSEWYAKITDEFYL